MTKEEIIKMADTSGLSFYGMGKDREKFINYLERFAELVAEREPIGCAECKTNGGHALYCVACAENFVGGYKDSSWIVLTEDEIKEFDTWHDNREEEVGWCNSSEIVAYIEAKLKDKNTRGQK
jgi:hypothetical protein